MTVWYKAWHKYERTSSPWYKSINLDDDTSDDVINEWIVDDIHDTMHSEYQEVYNIDHEIIRMPPRDWLLDEAAKFRESALNYLTAAEEYEELANRQDKNDEK